MRLVRQPEDSSLCGQACVATLAGITLDESIEIFGTKGKTYGTHLVAALRCVGIDSATKLKRGLPDINSTAILKYTHPNGKAHWVVWHKRKFYDPHAGVFRKEPKWLHESRVTSHLEVKL